VVVPAKSKETAERLSSMASAIRGRAEYRDFLITNTDSELSINTSYYEVDPDECDATHVTPSLTLRPGDSGAFDIEALVYTEGELDAYESSYSNDLPSTAIETDEAALAVVEDYMTTVRQEIEDGLKNGTVSLTDPNYDEWFSMGMNSEVKAKWGSKFNSDEARQWLDRGFTFEEAMMWDGSGFRPDQAGRLTEEGNFTKPAEVIEWRDRGGFSEYDACILRENGVTLDEAIDWHECGFDAGETARLREKGFSLKEAANWHNTGGFSGNEIANPH
jgi:hypothetical protein